MKNTSLRQQRAADRPPKGERNQRKAETQEQRVTGPLTTERLCDIWEKILSDSDGRRALEQLDKAGFRMSHLKPRDATFKHPSWADYVSALPLLPDEPSTRRIHSNGSLHKYWPIVRELRRVAANMNAPFVEVTIFRSKDFPESDLTTSPDDLLKTAAILEDFFSWNYCVRNLNPRHALVAELRWTIREKTGRPHDRELNDLIASAFRAAGSKEYCYIDSTTLERIEKRQRESRVKAHQRIRRLLSTSRPSSRH